MAPIEAQLMKLHGSMEGLFIQAERRSAAIDGADWNDELTRGMGRQP